MGRRGLCHVYVSLGYTTMGGIRLYHVYVSLGCTTWDGGGYVMCMLA